MPHPKAEINPLWGIRLKEICEQCDIRQAELAKRIFISQQTISKIINGKATLTLQTAQRIIDLYPQYRIEWLTGRDDYKTYNDVFNALFDKHNAKYGMQIMALKSLAELRGFEIIPDSSGAVLVPSGGYEDIYIVRHERKQFYASYSEIVEWVDDVCDFAELKLTRLMNKKGGSNNG